MTSSASPPGNNARSFRPVLVIANSSWYLLHYRHLLLKTLQHLGEHVVALSPVDSTTPSLSRLVIHIPWRIHRSNDANLLFSGVSFLRMLFLVRAIKPRLVHSHTLKANLLASIVTSLFGVPCVLSFAGMGRLSKAWGFSRLGFLLVLRSIAFFSRHQRCSRWCWQLSSKRTALIFQNPIDKQLFQEALPNFPTIDLQLIFGSGVPDRYFETDSTWLRNYQGWSNKPFAKLPCCDMIFCGRLLRSKGIGMFLELAGALDDHTFRVFGGVDFSSNDSLLDSDILKLQNQYPNVIFEGMQPDPLLNLDVPYPILLVPSNYGEGLPRASAEALALGIPVFISRSATCGIFSDEIMYVAESGSLGDYLLCFDRLMADHAAGRLQHRLQAGRKLVEQQLSEEAIVQQTLSLYSQLDSDFNQSYLLSKDDKRLNDWLAQ